MRASVQRLGQQFGVQLSLNNVYRMMDRLDAGCISRLKRLVTQQVQKLFKEPLDVLFFDCTTLYFESFVEDALKQFGYRKDAKFKECQVLLALMISPAGLPVSYELLPGATFEGHSLIPLVEKLRTEFELRNVVCVADRGLLSNDKLQALQEAGMYYIVGARLKSLPRKLQAQVLELDAYERISPGGLRVRSLAQGRRRVMVSHCPKRATKDQKDRRSAQRYAIPMQLSQVAKKLYWMMGVERSSVPCEID